MTAREAALFAEAYGLKPPPTAAAWGQQGNVHEKLLTALRNLSEFDGV